MNAAKCVLAIVAGGAFGVLAAGILLGLGPSRGAAVLCVGALAVLVVDGLMRRRELDDQRRLNREAVWRRRDKEVGIEPR